MKRTWPAVAPAKGTATLPPGARGAAEGLLRRPQRSHSDTQFEFTTGTHSVATHVLTPEGSDADMPEHA